MFLNKWLELVELCLFLYPEQHFRFRTMSILTPILTRKPHSFFFFFLNHQRLPKTFISHEKFGFLWICPEKHLLKPLKIAVFALKMTYFGHENGLSWIMLIFKLQIFLKILADNLISFQKRLYFFEKSLGLIFWNVLLTSIETIWELYRVRISSLLFAKCKGILSLCEALSQRNSKNRS